ncbi:MAG: cytochrome P450 [Dehalococcoidia bacterium]
MSAPSLSDHPADHVDDPYPYYQLLRESDPVHFDERRGTWLVARHEDVSRLLRDDVRLSAVQGGGPNANMLGSDPPKHTRLRTLVSKAFTPRAVRQLQPRIHEIVDELLDVAAANGEVDAIADFAYPLPITIIGEMLGVPAAERGFFRAASTKVALSAGYAQDPHATSRASEGREEMVRYFEDLIRRRRADPQDDLVTACIQAEDEGDRLTHGELMAMLLILLIGGHETTVNLIGNGLLALLRNPGQLELLRREPLEREATEEMLRYDAPSQYTGRVAAQDFELHGRAIKAGQAVRMLLASANRDADVFTDPDGVDISRAPNPHVAFGAGIHYCLGGELARLEGQIAISTMVRRFPNLALAETELRWRPAPVFRGLEALPLTL